MRTLTIEVPQDVLESARLSPDQARVELAIYLYSQGRLSVGKARELAGMSLWEFRQLLGARRIVSHYDETELESDVQTLRALDLK
jgi:predicted HTH domain antitoxin